MSSVDDPRRGPRRYGPSAAAAPSDRSYPARPTDAPADLDNPWPRAAESRAATADQYPSATPPSAPSGPYRSSAPYRQDPTPGRPSAPSGRYETPGRPSAPSGPYQAPGRSPSPSGQYPAPRPAPLRSSPSSRQYPVSGRSSAPYGQDPGPTTALPIGARAWSAADPVTAVIPPPERTAPRTPPPPPRPPVNPGHGGGDGSHRPPRRRTKGSVIAARIIAGFVAALLLTVTGVAWATLGTTPQNASDATDAAGNVGVVTPSGSTTDANGKVVPVSNVPATNILVVGSDARTDSEGNPLSPDELKAVSAQLDGGGINTDTIMILHIPEGGAQATAISIPRDTWMDSSVVGAPGLDGPYSDGTSGPYKPNKINSFYGSAKAYTEQYLASKGVTGAERERESNEAGRTMLIKVVQQFTGLKINHYAEINLIGFYLLSNAIGGVPVCLNKAVKDRQSGADFPAGPQEVSGSAALSFVRQRHGLPGGDLDRIRRQQAFLAGAANKILSVGTLSSPSKLSALVSAADRSLVLDKNFDLLSFGQQMVGLTSGHISFVTIPIAGSADATGTDALATDPAKIRAFFAALSAGSATTSSSAGTTSSAPTTVNRGAWTVDVQNGTVVSGMAASVGQKAADAGFQRGQMSDYPDVTQDNQQATTSIHYSSGGEAAATALQKVIGHGTLVADDAVAANHLLVIAGRDLPKPSGLRGSAGALLSSVAGSGSDTGSGSGSGGNAAGAPTTSSAPVTGVDGTGGDTINAAHPGCVN